ncbi:SHOCT domain-containing protein [Nocardia donostiensis]|uniref:Cardiolipin synthase N-terminal domain-containing protein n=1 Tax=Nocardia donostiensis TaxID=1538463 RepID=A0A1V2THH3_9NOCA|nr:SHOCT domain-containing protein [Nocardia donostiensis]ONM48821.1 hypothetical protein B0T46_10050 [Nocardia donostiensis]OQS12978.1 hypothetical protein B0T36_21905 [Nocardia donostiensis]OQS22924.1 hypothetical protein B0T44_04415 [Nocardia donostiensis]
MFDSFWDLLWYTIVVFAFVAYLVVLFQILVDLFRDHSLSGFAKVLWIVGLVVLPYLTAFGYLIARGRSMAERAQAARRDDQRAAEEYIRQVAGKSPAAQITDAKALQDSGAITDAEFEQLKANALAGNVSQRNDLPIR